MIENETGRFVEDMKHANHLGDALEFLTWFVKLNCNKRPCFNKRLRLSSKPTNCKNA